MAKRGRKREAKVEAVTPDRLKSFVDRIIRLMEEREAIGGDITDIFSEAKSIGYDTSTMRKVIRIFRMDAADRAAEADQLEIYLRALGLSDRVQNRVAAGETLDGAAKAEGITKSRAHRIVSKPHHVAEPKQKPPLPNSMGTASHNDGIDPATGEITESPPGTAGAAESRHPRVTTRPAASAAPIETGDRISPHGPPENAGPPASDGDRLASIADDDPLTIPPFLDRRPKRGVAA